MILEGAILGLLIEAALLGGCPQPEKPKAEDPETEDPETEEPEAD